MHINAIKEHFASFINDPGIQLSHSEKDNISIDDIFIFPDLIDRNNSIINSRELLKIDGRGNNLIISGSEDSGNKSFHSWNQRHKGEGSKSAILNNRG